MGKAPGKLKTEKKIRKHHYCVLYTNVLKQREVCSVLKKALPEKRGTVFYPCMECYRRDAGGKIVIQPIFPGYIFIRSDMGNAQLHEFIKSNLSGIMAFVRELKLSQRKASGEFAFIERDKGGDKTKTGYVDGAGGGLSDLTDEEAEFMDFLFDAGNMDDGGHGSAHGKNMLAGGLLRMSYGYKEGSRYKVMEGPLRAYESHIEGVNNHDKKAFLDFKINGNIVRAGFDVMPKRYWFPEDKDAPKALADGTEVDLQSLAKAMMG